MSKNSRKRMASVMLAIIVGAFYITIMGIVSNNDKFFYGLISETKRGLYE